MELYDGVSAKYYQDIWEQLCDMAYLNERVTEEVVILPLNPMFFRNARSFPYEITFDYTWDIYSKKYPDSGIVPELKKLHVPLELIDSLGVQTWLKHTFPNCLVTFW